MTQVRVLLWGAGEIGRRAAGILLDRPQVEIVGAISHQVGVDLGRAIGGADTGVVIGATPEDLGPIRADVCLLATHQRVPDLLPQIEWLLDHGMCVIVSGEEMIFPWASHPDLADKIDAKARAAGLTVYGTGINPGFVMDILPLCLTSCCASVRRIDVMRSCDFSPYGPGPLRSLGVGLTPEEFGTGLAAGTVDGYIGFRESIGVIARALGWEIEEYREQIEPIVTTVERSTPHITVGPGRVVGCAHTAEALIGGTVVIRLDHPQQIEPAAENAPVGDVVTIDGDPPIVMKITPEIEGGQSTAARMVNSIGPVLGGPPGLVAMDQLTLPFVTPRGTPGTPAQATTP